MSAVRTVHEHSLACGHKYRSRHRLAAALCGACEALRDVKAVATYDVDRNGNVVRGVRS